MLRPIAVLVAVALLCGVGAPLRAAAPSSSEAARTWARARASTEGPWEAWGRWRRRPDDRWRLYAWAAAAGDVAHRDLALALLARHPDGLSLSLLGRAEQVMGDRDRWEPPPPRDDGSAADDGTLEALELLGQALAAEPDLAPAHALRAVALMRRGRVDEAREAAERGAALAPDAGWVRLVAGRCAMVDSGARFLRQGWDRARALEHLTAALASPGGWPDAGGPALAAHLAFKARMTAPSGVVGGPGADAQGALAFLEGWCRDHPGAESAREDLVGALARRGAYGRARAVLAGDGSPEAAVLRRRLDLLEALDDEGPRSVRIEGGQVVVAPRALPGGLRPLWFVWDGGAWQLGPHRLTPDGAGEWSVRVPVPPPGTWRYAFRDERPGGDDFVHDGRAPDAAGASGAFTVTTGGALAQEPADPVAWHLERSWLAPAGLGDSVALREAGRALALAPRSSAALRLFAAALPLDPESLAAAWPVTEAGGPPSPAQAAYLAGLVAREDGDDDGARALFGTALAAGLEGAPVLTDLADLTDDASERMGLLVAALGADPLYDDAVGSLDDEDPGSVVEALDAAYRASGDPEVGALLAERLACAERWEEARELWRAVLPPRRNLGWDAWVGLIRAESALAATGEAGATDDSRLALLEESLRALPYERDAFEAYRELVADLEAEEREAAFYEELRREHPDSAPLQMSRGLLFEAADRPDRALDVYGIACRLAPEWAWARQLHGRLLLERRRPDEGLDELRASLDLDPGNVFVVSLVAGELARRGRSDERLELLERTLPEATDDDQRSWLLLEIARMRGRRGDHEAVLAAGSRVLALPAAGPRRRGEAAWLQVRAALALGRPSPAASALGAVVRDDPAVGLVLAFLAAGLGLGGLVVGIGLVLVLGRRLPWIRSAVVAALVLGTAWTAAALGWLIAGGLGADPVSEAWADLLLWAILALVLLPSGLMLLLWRGRGIAGLRPLAPPRVGRLAGAVLAGAAAGLVIAGLEALLRTVGGTGPGAPPGFALAALMGSSVPGLVVALAVLVVAVPVAEETFYRAWLHGGWQVTMGRPRATVVGAVLYAVAGPGSFLSRLLLSPLLAFLRDRDGSVWSAVVARAAAVAVLTWSLWVAYLG